MNQTKECTRCHLPKDHLEFRKYKTYCKACENLQTKTYKAEHRKEISEYNSQYKTGHKNETSIYNKQYRDENKEATRSYKKQYESHRRDSDPAYRLRQDVSNYIGVMLRANGGSKENQSCLKYLPYTMQELKAHLEKQFEPWMTWDNWGTYNPKSWRDNDPSTWTWQIDHIIPRSIFTCASMADEQFLKCWALENLRPLSAKQNAIDGATRIRHTNKT